MGNGANEELTFTRSDSDRLVRIEEKLDEVIELKDKVIRNTVWIKAIKWSMGGGGILLILKIFNVM